MLDFPSYTSISWLGILFIIAGIGGFLQAIYSTTSKSQKESFANIMLLVVGPLFFVVGVLTVYSTTASIYRFRQLPVDQISGFSVTRMIDEMTPNGGRSKTFTDQESAKDAIKLLRGCQQTYNNHQTYSDGYAFTVLFNSNVTTEDYTFTAFRLTNGKPDVKTVVIVAGKEFSCPTFQKWVKDNIDPLF